MGTMDGVSFGTWLLERLTVDGVITEEEAADMADDFDEEVLLDNVDGMDTDEIATYAGIYSKACAEDNAEPDFSGFEDYEG